MESKIMWNNQTVGVTAPGLSHGGLGTAFLGSATIKTALKTLSPCYSTFRRGTHCPLISDTISPRQRGRGTEDCPVCWRKRVVENQRQDRDCVLVSSGCRSKAPQTGGLNHRHLLSHCSGGWKSRLKASTVLVLSEGPKE